MGNPEQLNIIEETQEKNETTPEVAPEKPLKEMLDEQTIQDQRERDHAEIEEITASLEKEIRESSQWRAVRKPREEWYEEKEAATDDPLNSLLKWAKSFSRAERENRKINEECKRDYYADSDKYPETVFDYKQGSGVEGRVARKTAIRAQGFYECSGLVFQTKEGVSVVHISPNILKGTFAGGERVRDENIDGHIKSALKTLLDGKESVETTNGSTELTSQEIEALQKMADSGELKSTLFSGEEQFVPHEIACNLGQDARFHKLPSVKTDIHYVSNRTGKGYIVYASPNKIYCIGSNNVVMEQGKNFPPTMYDFEKKKI
jgi:hypothetical protein